MNIHKFCISLFLFLSVFSATALGQESPESAKVQHILSICSSDRTRMDHALDFLKQEVTFKTQLSPEEGRDWLPKALMNEKISLSYDNLFTARSNVDLDCKSSDYMSSLLAKLQSGESISQDFMLVNQTFDQLNTSITTWKKEYTVFWQILTETINQYQDNMKVKDSNIPVQ